MLHREYLTERTDDRSGDTRKLSTLGESNSPALKLSRNRTLNVGSRKGERGKGVEL
jgi:hypothetical protein